MYIKVSKENLLRGIQIVETAVSSKTTLPVLSNFLVEAVQDKNSDDSGEIKLVSTDLEIAVSCYIQGKIKIAGGITIPAKRFGNIIRELPEQEIEIKTDDKNQIDIKAGKSHFVLSGTQKEDFPALPEFSDEKAMVIETKLLKEIIKKTSFAISTDETRYVLTGLYFIIEPGVIRTVATDGRRLAYICRKGITNKTSMKAIIPNKAINEVSRLFSIEEDENVKISITENQASFKIKDITLISRLVDGEFPNYEQVIPKKYQHKIQIESKILLSATKQISLLTQEKGGAVKFAYGKNALRISAQVQGLGSGEVDMDIAYTGPSIEIAFNPSYVIDILKNINEDKVEFQINGPIDACVLKSINDEDYICVVMPMRV
ncbi:MAG: DNA polymerase III subunit beta [Elusimicrobia bacterium]|nr:DNA polymerase III subunit beta [Elusimicrobiota bacterium]MBU2614194.1 DNA polymerase III subunit beta [Elusimicrobiota bacterium]